MSKHEPLRILSFTGLIHRSHDYCNIIETGIVASTNLQPYPIADSDLAAMLRRIPPVFRPLGHFLMNRVIRLKDLVRHGTCNPTASAHATNCIVALHSAGSGPVAIGSGKAPLRAGRGGG
jgi:hypothetical protein